MYMYIYTCIYTMCILCIVHSAVIYLVQGSIYHTSMERGTRSMVELLCTTCMYMYMYIVQVHIVQYDVRTCKYAVHITCTMYSFVSAFYMYIVRVHVHHYVYMYLSYRTMYSYLVRCALYSYTYVLGTSTQHVYKCTSYRVHPRTSRGTYMYDVQVDYSL